MSFEDDTIWAVNLNLYNSEPEALPITKITEHSVWTEMWSGKVILPDGKYQNIGKCRRIRLDREDFVRNGWQDRGRMMFYFYYPHVYDDEYEGCNP